jgi:hypothetical protein
MLEDGERFWLSCHDPLELLKALYPVRTHGSERPQTRQSRMYLVACARRRWAQLPRACRLLVNLAESVAEPRRGREGLRAAVASIALELMHSDTDPEDFAWAESALEEANLGAEFEAARLGAGDDCPPNHHLPPAWWALARLVYLPFEQNTPSYHWVGPSLHSVELLREVYGNPYRRLLFNPAWRTATVTTLARQMYDGRDFGAMPILADALQDAGCDSEEVLNHCRAGGEHVRGCWVVDTVLQLR